MKADALITFADGSELLVSTQYGGDGQFICELYRAVAGAMGKLDLRAVSNELHAATCGEAQESAYRYARQQYPERADMKQPPYLIWSGPKAAVDPEYRGRRNKWRNGGES